MENNYKNEINKMCSFEKDSISMSFPLLDCIGDIKNVVLKDALSEALKFHNCWAFSRQKEDDMYHAMNGPNDMQCDYIGVDIPVLLSPASENEVKGKVFIVGESPIRNTRKKIVKNHKGKIIIGFPFAVDCEQGVPEQCDIYKYIFNRLVNEGYKVYITDAVKVWNDKLEKKDFITNIDTDTLNKEIEKEDPTLIVLWGDTAKKVVDDTFPNDQRHFHQTHPVRLNWDRWGFEMCKEALKNNPIAAIGKEYASNGEEKDLVKYLAYYISEEILQELKKPKAVT